MKKKLKKKILEINNWAKQRIEEKPCSVGDLNRIEDDRLQQIKTLKGNK